MENEKGIYFSEYMRQPQLNLLHFIGRKDAQLAWKTGYKPTTKRTHKTSEFNYSFTTNELGLRGNLPSIKKDSNEYRIVVLGDSFIEGFGADDSATFPYLLEEKLRKINKKISVINGGICGSSPIYEIELYKNKLEQYQPDLVILETNITDLQDIVYAKHQNKMPLFEYFYACSHIYRGFYIGVFHNDIENSKCNKKILQLRNESIDSIILNCTNFQNYILEKQIKFISIYIPMKQEIYRNKMDDKPTNQLIHSLIAAKIPLINLKDEYKNANFKDRDAIQKYYWKIDGHHNSTGYQKMAEICTNYLIKNNYVRTH